jgi:hypothetical protein
VIFIEVNKHFWSLEAKIVLLPAFIIESKAELQLEVRGNKVVFFFSLSLSNFTDPPAKNAALEVFVIRLACTRCSLCQQLHCLLPTLGNTAPSLLIVSFREIICGPSKYFQTSDVLLTYSMEQSPS